MSHYNSAKVQRGEVPLYTFASWEAVKTFAETIVDTHDDIVNKAGYSPTISRKLREQMIEKVESVLSTVFTEHFGQPPQYEDLFVQVNVFAEHLAKDHIFPDGNKRTALKASLALLHINGVEVDIPDQDDMCENQVYQWIQQIVSGQYDVGHLADALRKHATYVGSTNLFS